LDSGAPGVAIRGTSAHAFCILGVDLRLVDAAPYIRLLIEPGTESGLRIIIPHIKERTHV
jgi:hypothetical protein